MTPSDHAKTCLEAAGMTVSRATPLTVEATSPNGHKVIVAFTPDEAGTFTAQNVETRVKNGLRSLCNAYGDKA